MASGPRTLAEKVWDAHVVRRAEGEPDLLYIDLHLIHEVTSPQAMSGLRAAGRAVRGCLLRRLLHRLQLLAGRKADEEPLTVAHARDVVECACHRNDRLVGDSRLGS